MAKLSAFADEVTESLLQQAKYLSAEHIDFIEIRFVDKKNIMDLTNHELNEAKKILNDYGIKVSAIGSPIGKVRLDEPFLGHLDKFKHAVDLAMFFQSPFIRMFSYYPPEGRDIADYRGEVLDRMYEKVEIIRDADVIMVHENEANIYGHTAENCVDLVKTVDSPKLKLAYDPANFVWGEKITDNIESCWPLMKPYVVHVHIKDWKLGADIGSVPGEGHGQIKELLAELAAIDYDGFLTMEPHLKVGGQFGGSTGPELFSIATDAVRELAAEVGLKCD